MKGRLEPKYGFGRLPRYCFIPGTLVLLAETCQTTIYINMIAVVIIAYIPHNFVQTKVCTTTFS